MITEFRCHLWILRGKKGPWWNWFRNINHVCARWLYSLPGGRKPVSNQSQLNLDQPVRIYKYLQTTANISPSAPMRTTLHWRVAKRLYSSIKAKCWASFWKWTEVLQQQHSYLWRKFCFRSARFQVEETLWLQTALHSVLLVLLSPARNQSLDLENCSQRPFIRHENKTARSRRSAEAFSSSEQPAVIVTADRFASAERERSEPFNTKSPAQAERLIIISVPVFLMMLTEFLLQFGLIVTINWTCGSAHMISGYYRQGEAAGPDRTLK